MSDKKHHKVISMVMCVSLSPKLKTRLVYIACSKTNPELHSKALQIEKHLKEGRVWFWFTVWGNTVHHGSGSMTSGRGGSGSHGHRKQTCLIASSLFLSWRQVREMEPPIFRVVFLPQSNPFWKYPHRHLRDMFPWWFKVQSSWQWKWTIIRSVQPNLIQKNRSPSQVVVAYTFNPSTCEAEAGRFLSLRPAWSTEWVLGQPGLYRETLSQKTKTNRQNKNKNNKKKIKQPPPQKKPGAHTSYFKRVNLAWGVCYICISRLNTTVKVNPKSCNCRKEPLHLEFDGSQRKKLWLSESRILKNSHGTATQTSEGEKSPEGYV
jgi:hypothetical protein